MTTAWDGIVPERQFSGDAFQYLLASALGLLAGWVDIRVGDLLFTALIVLASCMLLGFVRPRHAWRWVLLVGIFVPLMEWFAYSVLSQKPDRAQIYEAFLAFLPGIVGAYGGAFGRGVVTNLFGNK
jgi:ABC-type multidrug transport system permease subunit